MLIGVRKWEEIIFFLRGLYRFNVGSSSQFRMMWVIWVEVKSEKNQIIYSIKRGLLKAGCSVIFFWIFLAI